MSEKLDGRMDDGRIKKLTCRWGCTGENRVSKKLEIQNIPPIYRQKQKYNNRCYLTLENRGVET